MKKVWKKIGKYSLLLILALIGLACVGVLYLFFVPGSNLFNITYISHNTKLESDKYAPSAVSAVVLNSKNYNVSVEAVEDNNISLEVYNNSFGFVLTENRNASIKEKLVGTTLEFNVKESYGFALPNN